MAACSSFSATPTWMRAPTSTRGTGFPAFRLNQFGGSFGGPVVIPKVYHGKDKTFFFVDYEGFRNSVQIFERGNIPTLRMRTGDFGELLPNTLIYDPLTTVPNPAKPGSFLRTPFPNNIIPLDRFDPIACKMINAYPTPTSTARMNNYSQARIQMQNYDQGDVRIDEQITAKDSVFARWSIQNTSTDFAQHLRPDHYSRDFNTRQSER